MNCSLRQTVFWDKLVPSNLEVDWCLTLRVSASEAEVDTITVHEDQKAYFTFWASGYCHLARRNFLTNRMRAPRTINALPIFSIVTPFPQATGEYFMYSRASSGKRDIYPINNFLNDQQTPNTATRKNTIGTIHVGGSSS